MTLNDASIGPVRRPLYSQRHRKSGWRSHRHASGGTPSEERVRPRVPYHSPLSVRLHQMVPSKLLEDQRAFRCGLFLRYRLSTTVPRKSIAAVSCEGRASFKAFGLLYNFDAAGWINHLFPKQALYNWKRAFTLQRLKASKHTRTPQSLHARRVHFNLGFGF